jgi:hypothetical protein
LAIQTRTFVTMNDGACVGTYSYDDSNNLMTQVAVTNSGASGVFRYEVHSIVDNSIVTKGQVAVGDQTLTVNLIPFNIHMQLLGPGGTHLQPPFNWTTSWAPS